MHENAQNPQKLGPALGVRTQSPSVARPVPSDSVLFFKRSPSHTPASLRPGPGVSLAQEQERELIFGPEPVSCESPLSLARGWSGATKTCTRLLLQVLWA